MSNLSIAETSLIKDIIYNVAGQDLEYKGIVKCNIKIHVCPVDCKGLILFGDRHECFRNLSDNKLANNTIFEKEIK